MNFPAKTVMQRYAFVATLLVLACVGVVAKTIYTMTVKKDYWMEVSKKFVKENVVDWPTRGNILAAGGEVLASSLPEYKIFMDFMSWEKNPKRRVKDQHRRDSLLTVKMDSICEGMHAVLPDIDPAAMRKHLEEGRKQKSHHWPLYKKRITYIQYRQLKALPLFRLSANSGGFHVEELKTRKNPYGRLAIRTIGDLYKGKDSARTGLELSFDSILRGKPGKAHRQKVLNRYLTIVDEPAVDGCDVVTTLDVSMQDICEKALSDKLTELEAEEGLCILMEVATGDIKAMTSLTRMGDGIYQEVNVQAVSNLLEPGSVFKPMSFLVAMDDGYLHVTDQVDVQHGQKEMYGSLMRDANWRSGGNGVLTVPQILQKSSNVGVSTFIDRFYHDNPRKFVEGLYRIGVAEDLQIPIPGYKRPRIRMPKEDGSNWSKTALPWMSIGYETQIPPITTVNFYNGIANNGKLLRPRLVKAIMRGNEVVKEYPVVVLREHMAKPEVIKDMQYCLESVVSVGLGKKAGSKYFHVSGKTGTAQVWTKHGFASQYLVSFVGYFPSEAPQYSCIVCIKKGAPASGGGMCAPVFKRVAETVMAQRRVNDYSQARDTLNCQYPVVDAGNMNAATAVLDQLGISHDNRLPDTGGGPAWGVCHTSDGGLVLDTAAQAAVNAVPDVRGYGLRDAVFRLEKIGLKVRVQGVGAVSRQSLEPGHQFDPGDEIVLTLGNPDRLPAKAAARDTVRTDAPPAKAEQTPAAAQPAAKAVKQAEKPQKKEATQREKAAATEPKKKAAEPKKKTADPKPKTEKPKAAASKKKSEASATKKPKAKPAATASKKKADARKQG